MFKRITVYVFLCLMFLLRFMQPCFAVFENVTGIDKASISKISFHKTDTDLVYISSENSIFKSKDGGKNWQKIFISKDGEIKDFYIDDQLFDVLYVASMFSVYKIDSSGVKKIFTLNADEESMSLLKVGGYIYLGTTNGLYSTRDDFLKWNKVQAIPNETKVCSLDSNSDFLYALADKYIYRANDGLKFKKIAFLKSIDPEILDEYTQEFGTIKIDLFDSNTLYLGLASGLYVSYDKGDTWQNIFVGAIKGAEIRRIAQTKKENNSLYLATDRGVFLIKLDSKTHKILFEGLSTKDINWVEFNESGIIYAATNRGLFFKNQFSPLGGSSLPSELLMSQPEICEVQDKALRYNEAHPDKVKKWIKSLKYRALLPSLDLDYDKTVTYDSGIDRFQVGPYDWGVGLSWNMADLIWNSYEDDIDTRSRLVTQLRISILDNVNAIYFERLRVRADLIRNPEMEESEKFKKELRLLELNAALDGYTGGYFSKRLRELSNN